MEIFEEDTFRTSREQSKASVVFRLLQELKLIVQMEPLSVVHNHLLYALAASNLSMLTLYKKNGLFECQVLINYAYFLFSYFANYLSIKFILGAGLPE